MVLTKDERNRVVENHNLIYAYCQKKNLDIGEWYGVLGETLCKCAKHYNESSGTKFSTFVYASFKNAVYADYKNRHLDRVVPQEKIVSLYEKVPDTEGGQ